MVYPVIDVLRVEQQFHRYVKGFNRNQPEIRLKIEHTERVVDLTWELVQKMGLDEEQKALAATIAWLHDIGRFQQWQNYGTFGDKEHSHAAIGVDLLFEKNGGIIRQFVPSDKANRVIRVAIERHGDLTLKTDDLTDEEIVFCQLIRDADVLDNMTYVKTREPLELLFHGTGYNDLCGGTITHDIHDTFMFGRPINYADIQTELDWAVAWCAYLFNLSSVAAVEIVKATDCISRFLDRIQYRDEQTWMEVQAMKEFAADYVDRWLRFGEKPTVRRKLEDIVE